MSSDEIYDLIQEVKTAFVITFLIVVYCLSVVLESLAADMDGKVICSSIGLLIVATIDALLFMRLIWLRKESKNILKDSN